MKNNNIPEDLKAQLEWEIKDKIGWGTVQPSPETEDVDVTGTVELEEPSIAKEEVIEDKPKTSDNFKKVLAEKNQYKSKARTLEDELKKAKDEIQSLKTGRSDLWDEDLEDHDLKLVDAVSKKNILENDIKKLSNDEIIDFYVNNPEAKDYKSEIEELANEHPTLSLNAIYKLFLAMNNPELLLDEPTKNKLKESSINMSWTAQKQSEKWASKDINSMSTDDLKSQLKNSFSKGILTL